MAPTRKRHIGRTRRELGSVPGMLVHASLILENG